MSTLRIRVIVRVLREHMAVQMRHPMPHHEVVDLSRRERRADRFPDALNIGPERAQLRGGEVRQICDVFPEDDDAISFVCLVPSETDMSHVRGGDEHTVLVLFKMCVRAHTAGIGRVQLRPLVIRPPHGSTVAAVGPGQPLNRYGMPSAARSVRA